MGRKDINYAKNDMQFTPENIEELGDGQVFIFGSNLAGNHVGGAAKMALERFGAIYGLGEGLAEQSYAFPTLDEHFQKRTDEELKESVERLKRIMERYTDKQFLLTRVGCGIAGYDEEYMKNLFKDMPENLIKPKGW